MATKLIAMKCPSCGATLDVPADKDKCFCTYCGTQILIDDGSYTVTHRTIDDAKVVEAKTNAEISKQQFGIDMARGNIVFLAALVLGAIALLFGILAAITGSSSLKTFALMACIGSVGGFAFTYSTRFKGGNANKTSGFTEVPDENHAKLPISTSTAIYKQIKDIVPILEKAGFTNISTLGMGDVNVLTSKLLKDGSISHMTIDGKDGIEAGTVLPKDATIVIKYHSR